MPRAASTFSLFAVASLALASVACSHNPQPQAPHNLTVQKIENPDDAPEEAKTIQVAYTFPRDLMNKDFTKTLKDGFEKGGVKVTEEVNAKAHFDVVDTKIVGTVTYVKKGMGRYSILEANLEASGHYDADVEVEVDVQAKGDTSKATADDWGKTPLGGKPMELAKNVMPTNIPIAGPLFLHAHFDLSAACNLEVEGQLHAKTGVGVKGDVKIGAKYKKDGFPGENGKKSKFAFEAGAPNFEWAPKPYLNVTQGKQRLKGRCELQPTAVLLFEHAVGAKLSVEPFVEMEAKREPGARGAGAWSFDVQPGLSVVAATDMELFGRQVGKSKEFVLFETGGIKHEAAEPDLLAAGVSDTPAPPPKKKADIGKTVASIANGGKTQPLSRPSTNPLGALRSLTSKKR